MEGNAWAASVARAVGMLGLLAALGGVVATLMLAMWSAPARTGFGQPAWNPWPAAMLVAGACAAAFVVASGVMSQRWWALRSALALAAACVLLAWSGFEPAFAWVFVALLAWASMAVAALLAGRVMTPRGHVTPADTEDK